MLITTIIIEDNQEMGQFLADLLRDWGHATYVTHTGFEGLDLVRKIRPNLVLLDVILPDVEGMSLCNMIKREYPETIVILVTAKNSSQDLSAGLAHGADDYVSKPINAMVLPTQIKARLQSIQNQDSVLVCDDLQLNQRTCEVKRAEKKIVLTAQEFKLFEYLLLNKNIVLTREMILSRL